MIRRKQFNYFNDFTGEVIHEYKAGAGSVNEQASMCICLCCSLTPFLLKSPATQFEGLCHQDPKHPWITFKYHPSSLHILLSAQQGQRAAPALELAIQEARKYYARTQEVRGDRILGRPGKESV